MVRSRGKVTNGIRHYPRNQNKLRMALLWTVMLILSTSLLPNLAGAQSDNLSGGALGSLLKQLQTLKGTGAIDALEGRASSSLNLARERGTDAVSEIQERAASGQLLSAESLVRRGVLSQAQQLLAEMN